jgi:hypothetical protein
MRPHGARGSRARLLVPGFPRFTGLDAPRPACEPPRLAGSLLNSVPARRSPIYVFLALLLAPLTALLARPLGTHVRVDVGAFAAPILGDGWARAERASLDESEASERSVFYYRALPGQAALALPFEAQGPVSVSLRARALTMRCAVDVFISGTRAGEAVVLPRDWVRYTVAGRSEGPLDLGLAVRPIPLVRRSADERPDVLVDYLDVEAPGGLRFTARAAALLALGPLLVTLFLCALRVPPRAVLIASAAATLVVVVLAHRAPAAMVVAVPRLLPAACLAGLGVFALSRLLSRIGDGPLPAPALALAVALGVTAHGAVAFFPDHNPPDLDIHVRRTQDLAGVPLDYGAWLRYGSQLPTASQDLGAATAALGERTLIPYSPLPYIFYYALSAAGLDLYWALPVANTVIVLLVVPVLWGFARRMFDASAAWTAVWLYGLDLAVWHHLGRSHAPAVFGGALATAALFAYAWSAPALDTVRRAALMGIGLALAVLGYSSLVALVALLGVVLLFLLAVDARSLRPEARVGAASALVVGGLLSLVVFYGHYVPGLLGGARGVEAEPDLFPGRTFLFLHNESRQAMRLWALGLWIPVAAGLLAAPFALWRSPARFRPVLVAWLAGWAIFLVLKEPRFYPRLLRWAKEDQFVSPLLCLLMAGALSAIPEKRTRWALTALVLAVALWLQLRDFAHHANSLLL